jgi:NAD+--asparagine ADP-ribosyltransferase
MYLQTALSNLKTVKVQKSKLLKAVKAVRNKRMTESFCPANIARHFSGRRSFETASELRSGGNSRCRQSLGWQTLLKKKDLVNKSSLKLIESMPYNIHCVS